MCTIVHSNSAHNTYRAALHLMGTVQSGCAHSHFLQVALLWQRDRATRLSVEILQLQNIAIVWHYLRDPTFSRFYTIRSVTDTPTQTDGRTDTRRRHVLRLA